MAKQASDTKGTDPNGLYLKVFDEKNLESRIEEGGGANIAVGTTTTGAAGSNASVTTTQDGDVTKLNFTIPRGNVGATGATPTVAVGTTTTGAAGSNASVTATTSGTTTTLAFTVPRGAAGATGPAGFPTQAQWDALVARVAALESAGGA